jgi:hypothetical protein
MVVLCCALRVLLGKCFLLWQSVCVTKEKGSLGPLCVFVLEAREEQGTFLEGNNVCEEIVLFL